MPIASICLDCNALYAPSTDSTRAYGRCPRCRPAYLARKTRGKHADTPKRRLANSFYSSTAWRRARKQVKARDGACTSCGTLENLSVHHIVSIRDAPELALEAGNLTTLCTRCHGTHENDQRRRAKRRA